MPRRKTKRAQAKRRTRVKMSTVVRVEHSHTLCMLRCIVRAVHTDADGKFKNNL